MLVLTRKLNERIRIGEDIEITVVRLTDNRVKIGIAAPRGTKVLRGELDERKDSP
jgi:carbon storage regulator CsrA